MESSIRVSSLVLLRHYIRSNYVNWVSQSCRGAVLLRSLSDRGKVRMLHCLLGRKSVLVSVSISTSRCAAGETNLVVVS
jgi:hypothetical protein